MAQQASPNIERGEGNDAYRHPNQAGNRADRDVGQQSSTRCRLSFIDQSAAKLISSLTPDTVLALCKLAAKGLEIDSVISQLQADVINIQCDDSKANYEYADRRTAYLHAHRDTRHAAAGLVSAAFSGE